MRQKTLWITQTAALLALLIILQLATRSAGQLVTGSCVNAVLALAALIAGLSSSLTVAVLSPFLAFALGVGPKLLPIVPAIAVGNAALAALICLFARKNLSPGRRHGSRRRGQVRAAVSAGGAAALPRADAQ